MGTVVALLTLRVDHVLQESTDAVIFMVLTNLLPAINSPALKLWSFTQRVIYTEHCQTMLVRTGLCGRCAFGLRFSAFCSACAAVAVTVLTARNAVMLCRTAPSELWKDPSTPLPPSKPPCSESNYIRPYCKFYI